MKKENIIFVCYLTERKRRSQLKRFLNHYNLGRLEDYVNVNIYEYRPKTTIKLLGGKHKMYMVHKDVYYRGIEEKLRNNELEFINFELIE